MQYKFISLLTTFIFNAEGELVFLKWFTANDEENSIYMLIKIANKDD